MPYLLWVWFVGQPMPLAPMTQWQPISAAPATPTTPAAVEPAHSFLRQYDHDGDQQLAFHEVPEPLRRAFVATDQDRDGLLSAGEILYARSRIGRAARRMEELRLTGGHLEARPSRGTLAGGGAPRPGPFARGQGAQVQPQVPGYVSPPNATDFPTQLPPAPPPTTPVVAANEGTPYVTGEGGIAPAVAPANSAPAPAHENALAAPTAEPAIATDGLPSVDAMIAKLDRNGDGVIDSTEAVDQLADRFRAIDKDRNGVLDRVELDRALRLARLFGIKPKTDLKKTYGDPP